MLSIYEKKIGGQRTFERAIAILVNACFWPYKAYGERARARVLQPIIGSNLLNIDRRGLNEVSNC